MPFTRVQIRSNRLVFSTSLSLVSALVLGPSQAQSILPTNGVVSSGAASIRQSGADLSVVQTSPRAIVNWGSFSIGPANGVTFDQPSASSAILNRVTGSARSTIAGQLDANGQVYLVNPNGIAITPTGAVQVGGGFVASTLGIANNDFNKGNLSFSGKSDSAGVVNSGSIQAGPGGFVGLLGGTVSNSGVVSVPLGKVAMGSGEQATLNLTGDNFLQVAVPTNTKTADGQALVDVSGKVRAAGGLVQLKAATVARAIRNAVNVPGELAVSSARASGGSIILSGGAGGNVAISGKLAASGLGKGGTIAVSGRNANLNHATLAASSAGGQGGSVTVTGTNAVSLASTAVDASGTTGGGAIRIGGDFHGASDLTSAQTTTIDSASTLNASATSSGNGGTVAVWSTGATSVNGFILAEGGPRGGDGGQVETSGEILDYAGLSVNASSPHGKPGSWLLDPADLTIGPAQAATIDAALGSGTNMTESTSASGTGGAGDINVDAAISWSTAATLTLSAFHSIIFNAPMTIAGAGNLALTTNNNQGGTSSGGVLTFTQGQGSVQFTGGPTAGAGLSINGSPYGLLYSMNDLKTIIAGDGLGGNYALANNLPSTTTFTSAVIAPNSNAFTGTFEGLGNTISNLTIQATGTVTTSTTTRLGLFGLISGGTIENLGLVGGSVTNDSTHAVSNPPGIANASIGELVGSNNGGTITNVYATGVVNGGAETQSNIGGLVGAMGALIDNPVGGTIKNSYATGAVSGNGAGDNIGGLVGFSKTNSTITNSYATGPVSGGGSSDVGGLVGVNNNSAITDAYATGAVSGGSGANAGGLIGVAGGTITDVYATGAVSGGAGASVGGLVGTNKFGGAFIDAYWDTGTTGQSSSGGGVGMTTPLLQAALPTFQNPGSWGIVAGKSYPYLCFEFAGCTVTPQVVSGVAYSNQAGTTPAGAGLIVDALVNGAALNSAQTGGAVATGANGYYYYLLAPGSIPANGAVLTYANGAGSVNGAALVDQIASGAASNADIYANTLHIMTPAGAYSTAKADLMTALGNNGPVSAFVGGLANLTIDASNAFTVDQAITTPGNLGIQTTSATAPLTISEPIVVSNAGNLTLATGGGSLTIGAALSTATGSITLTGPTVLDPNVTTNGGNITFNNPVTLSANTTVDSGAGATTFVSTVDGGFNLTVSGVVVNFGGNVGSVTPLAGLTVTGLANLFGNVTTNNGPITFNNAVLLNTNVTLNSGAATTTFGGTVDSGDCACGLTASGGAFSFGAALGGTNPLGAVSLTSTNGVTLPSITASSLSATASSGGIVLSGAVDVTGGVALNAANDITEQVGAPITASSVQMNSTGGGIALGAPINATGSASFTAGGGAGILQQVGADITAQGGLTMTSTTGPITLNAPINPGVDPAAPVLLTAAGDIVQQSGAAIDATNLAMNSTGGGIALGAPINATGSASFTAGGGAGILQQTGADITTQAGLTMIATTGPITLDALVDPAGPVSLTAFGDIVEGAGAPGITATALSAISTTGRVVLTSANHVVSVSGSAPLGFTIADALPLSVGGIASTSGPIALGSLDGITQTGPIKGQSLYAGTVSGDIILTNANNSVATIAGTAGVTDEFLSSIARSIGQPLPPGVVAGPGTFQFYDSNPNLSIGAVNFYASVVKNTPVLGSASGIAATASNGADISIAVSNAGNLVVDSAVRSLSPVGIVQLAATGAFINNVGPAAIATSGGTWQVYSASPSGDVFDDLNSGATAVWDTRFGQPVTAAGDRYIFAFQPTITVTSGDLTKTYGQDVTSQVASDYTITGLEPGVPGAFLGDSASAVYSGTPSVTSLGSTARAPVTGGPYPITVGLGSLVIGDGYGLVANSTGTLTIDPLALTYAVANANSLFGTTPILGSATLFGVLPGDVVDPTIAAFRGLAPVALTPFTPVGQYAQLVTAISNPDYRIAPAPNFPGVLTVSAATANPGAPSDPGFLPGLTKINNPAGGGYDVGGFDQVLPRFTENCNEPPSLPDPNRYSDPDQALRAISQSLENYFKHCQNPTQTTIADALDTYAAKLQVLAPRLPPALRNVPTIIAEAARRVRAARSRAEAMAVLRETIATVHKEIALVLSEDPGTRSRELRDGDVIEGALSATSVALVNSGGL